jgi:hypothetical protein
MKIKPLFLAVTFLLLPELGSTREVPESGDSIARLEQAKADCQWKVRTLTGGPKGKMLLHQRAMENVLAKLKLGEPVDPKAIDQSFQGHRK